MDRVSIRSFAWKTGFVWLLVAAAVCAQQEAASQLGERDLQKKPIEAVLHEHTRDLMSLPGVVGTAEGKCAGEPCVKVLVAKKTPELLEQIGAALEGYPVEVVETGEFRAIESE